MPLSRENLLEDISHCEGRLLLAEDNAPLREYLVAVLRADGYDVTQASTADDLVDTLAVSFRPDVGSGEFDLVIAEDRLVLRSEAALVSRQWGRANTLPFILIGSSLARDAVDRILGACAVVSLGKPLDMDGLRSAVRRLARARVVSTRVHPRAADTTCPDGMSAAIEASSTPTAASTVRPKAASVAAAAMSPVALPCPVFESIGVAP